MTSPLGIGVIAIVGSLLAFIYFLFQPSLMNLRSEQMKVEEAEASENATETPLFDFIQGVLDRMGWRGFTEDQLAQAGIKVGRNSLIAIALLIAASTFLIVQVSSGSLFLAILLGAASTFSVSMYIRMRTAKRKAKFNRQMAETMTLLSSALKSGMNVPTGMANVATEMEEPMGEELARIVNESRLGRDMVNAMLETADRMESDDFKWVTEAISIQRESGGRPRLPGPWPGGHAQRGPQRGAGPRPRAGR